MNGIFVWKVSTVLTELCRVVVFVVVAVAVVVIPCITYLSILFYMCDGDMINRSSYL